MSFINPESLARISMTANTGAKTLTIGVKNPFRCWIPDATSPGSYFEKLITAPGVINGNGHASENFNLGEAGQTLAVAWGNNYPLYWYWVWDNINDVLAWVCSRNPCLKAMPASANNIGTTAAAPATSAQGNVFMNGNFTKANFVSLPVYGPIGSMPVQRTANQQQLDIVALTAGQDGFGLFQESVRFTMPILQNGATLGRLSAASGATTLAFNSEVMFYYIDHKTGKSSVIYNTSTRSASDAAASECRIHLPYAHANSYQPAQSPAIIVVNGTANWYVPEIYTNNSYFRMRGAVSAASIAALNVASFANANDAFQSVNITYQAF